MNKQLQLVNFEQAKKLKKLGFDLDCDYFYDKGILMYAPSPSLGLGDDIDPCSNWNHPDLDCNDGIEQPYVSAPTIALALKWFRDEKKIFGSVQTQWVCGEGLPFYGRGWKIRYSDLTCEAGPLLGIYQNYEEAESKLLDELLKILENE